jgi:GTP-binding protein Era
MKSGYVAITGKPNVGKSTFLNTLFNKKVSIVSPKPQTTRNKIETLYEQEDVSIVFIDTPGYHEARNKLDQFLNSQIKLSYKMADVVLLLVDLTRPIDEEDVQLIKIINDYQVKDVLLVLTKYDISSERVVNEYVNKIKSLIEIKSYLAISSKNITNINELINKVKTLLPETEHKLSITESDNFLISEIIREQIIFNTKKEIPYSTGVYVELNTYDQHSKLMNINAVIVVEKESQKPIIIGKGGSMIKKIGTNARKELLNYFDCKINLKLFVKVEKE